MGDRTVFLAKQIKAETAKDAHLKALGLKSKDSVLWSHCIDKHDAGISVNLLQDKWKKR